MMEKTSNFKKSFIRSNLPEINPGDTIRVSQKIKEGEKERIQDFEGVVLARKHKKEIGATITVRRIMSGIGVEKIFPLHSPLIEKIEILKKGKVKRAKLYYLRSVKGKKARIKRKEFAAIIPEEETTPEAAPEAEKTTQNTTA